MRKTCRIRLMVVLCDEYMCASVYVCVRNDGMLMCCIKYVCLSISVVDVINFRMWSPRNCYASHIFQTNVDWIYAWIEMFRGHLLYRNQYRIKCVNLRTGCANRKHSRIIISIVNAILLHQTSKMRSHILSISLVIADVFWGFEHCRCLSANDLSKMILERLCVCVSAVHTESLLSRWPNACPVPEWPIRSHLVSHFLNYSYNFLFANHKHFKIGTNMSRIRALSASRARGCKHTCFCCSNPFMAIHSHTLHFIV